jgi:hypothetical protein
MFFFVNPFYLQYLLCSSQRQSGRYGEVKIRDPTAKGTADSSVNQPVASRCTDCATAVLFRGSAILIEIYVT